MKTFKEILEGTTKFKGKKIKGVKVSVTYKNEKFEAKVDGDVLDTFDSEQDAWSAIETFMKNYKG